MRLEIPQPLKAEYNELHAQLAEATKQPGEIGEAAQAVAKLLHPHFVKEEEYALPPLRLLARLAQGSITPEMKGAVTMTDRLKAELPEMLAEHREIVRALDELAKAAGEHGRVE